LSHYHNPITASQPIKKKHTEKANSFPFKLTCRKSNSFPFKLTCRKSNSKKRKSYAYDLNRFQIKMEHITRHLHKNSEQSKLNRFQNKWSILLGIRTKIESDQSVAHNTR
jgi:hypothetical protein